MRPQVPQPGNQKRICSAPCWVGVAVAEHLVRNVRNSQEYIGVFIIEFIGLRKNILHLWASFSYDIPFILQLGNHEDALKLMTSCKKVAKENELKRYEMSEIILYEVTIMLEMKAYQRALDYLNEHKDKIVDKTAFHEYLITCYVNLGQHEKADDSIQ